MNIYYYDTYIGKIAITDNNEKITGIFINKNQELSNYNINETPLIKKASEQLNEYFQGKRKTFDIPLESCGTKFQNAVWKALIDIPYGEVRSYGQIAAAIGNPKACRAVGMANNKNPYSIVVPCHRVIGSDGKLVGYGGGLDVKEKLLKLEGSIKC